MESVIKEFEELWLMSITLSIKTRLRRSLVKRKWLIQLIHSFYWIFNKLKYLNAIFNRENIDLFDISNLCAEMPYTGKELIFDNNIYGIGNVLKKFSGFKGHINAYIEHGVYLGNHFDKNKWYAPKIVTYSNQRKKHLSDQNVNKDVCVIGPYIYYAEELFNEKKRLSIKNQLKKTLLVFPVHSATSLETKFDVKDFIIEIKHLLMKYSFDTILVCLYWKDANNKELVKLYTNAGSMVCSAGHKWDKDFLNRLKTIINLSDLTISNDVGTHIGYCTVLNKPHTILETKIEYVPIGSNGDNTYREELKTERQIEVNEIKEGFLKTDGALNIEINEVQKRLSDKYWGHDKIKTNNDIFSILS